MTKVDTGLIQVTVGFILWVILLTDGEVHSFSIITILALFLQAGVTAGRGTYLVVRAMWENKEAKP